MFRSNTTRISRRAFRLPGWDFVQSAPKAFDNLIHKREMPVTIAVFIQPGDIPLKDGETAKKRPDGRPAARRNRSVEYDSLGDTYARFLLEEILPEVGKKYNLTKDPDGRCIAGSSSGGICSFTVAWERPNEFRKVFSTVGSFTDIRGGHVYPYLIRKAEKKPIRVFLQDGSNDLDNQFGNWPLANQLMASSLKYKDYDYKFVYGEGVHSGKHGTAIFPDAMRIGCLARLSEGIGRRNSLFTFKRPSVRRWHRRSRPRAVATPGIGRRWIELPKLAQLLEQARINIFHEDVRKLAIAPDAEQAVNSRGGGKSPPILLVFQGKHGISNRRPQHAASQSTRHGRWV